MSTFNKLRKIIQEEIKKAINESDDDPKQARDDDDLLMRATELGELAFINDKPRHPGGDKKLMDLISVNKEKSKVLMKAWINGWDTKNLSEPVDLDESENSGMTLKQIKQAVESGKVVHWKSDQYTVIKDKLGQWLIGYDINGGNPNYIGLTWTDEVTMNGKPEDFYIATQED